MHEVLPIDKGIDVWANIGGNLANKAWIMNGEYDKITATAKELVRIVEEFEKQRNS